MSGLRVSRWVERWLLLTLVLAIGGFYVWTVRSSGDPWKFGREQTDYYNLLIDGWLDGQLNMKVAVPDALLRLKHPYDPLQRPPGLGLHDASFYHGKYYLYFGAAPVVVLMLPFRLLTGIDLPQPVAVIIFTYGGFLASVWTWRSIRRRYLPESGPIVSALCVAALGLAALGPMLLRRPHVWELPIAAGYCFAMLTLGCVYWSLHAARRKTWLAGAGLCLGLAIASRPTYLFATVLFAILLGWWWSEGRREGRWRVWPDRGWWGLVASVAVPLAVVGGLMALHNVLRFHDPLDFGHAYQFNLDVESTMPHFHLSYVWFNARAYFLLPAEWSRYFPFIQPAELPAPPRGHGGHDEVYGLLANLPFAWFALAAPLLAWRRDRSQGGPLRVWIGTAAGLCAIVAAVLLCFFGALARYLMDFTPALMLLAGVGVLGCERVARGWNSPAPRLALRLAWGGALLFSAVFAVLFSLQLNHFFPERNMRGYREVARVLNHVPAWIERLAGVRPGPVEITVRLSPGSPGREEVLLTSGRPPGIDWVFLRYPDAGYVQIGLARPAAPPRISRPLAVDFASPHRVRITLGGLLPPDTHPFFAAATPAQIAAATRRVRLEFDGEIVVDDTQRFAGGVAAGAKIGRDALPVAGGPTRFTGEVLGVRHDNERLAAAATGPAGFYRWRLRFPAGATGRREPLLSFGGAGAGGLIFVQYFDGGRVAFGCLLAGGPDEVQSPAVSVDFAQVHEVTLRVETALQPHERRAQMRIDGTLVWSRTIPWAAAETAPAASGRNTTGDPRCAAEFGGRIFSTEQRADGRDPLFGPGSAMKLTLRFPRGRSGTREPLVVTGRTGQGDQLEVEYLDERTVRFVLDHWGSALAVSGAVPVDFDQVHTVDVTMGSLATPADAATERVVRTGPLSVKVDGRLGWEQTTQFFVADPDELGVGRNPIGGSSGGAAFTGELQAAERGAP